MSNEITISNGNAVSLDSSGIESQIATAHKYPRDVKKSLQASMDLACLSDDIAASMFYKMPRKSKDGKTTYIEGPSVRLAEVVASNYRNIRLATSIKEVGAKSVVVQAMAHDLETNLATVTEVSRAIVSRDGRRYSDDMIQVTIAAAQAIARRNAVFQVVPRAIVDTIYEQAKKIAVGEVQTLDERRQNALAWFAKKGIDKEKVLARLGKKDESEIDRDDIETLLGFVTAIKDNMAKPEEIFDDNFGVSVADKLNEKEEEEGE